MNKLSFILIIINVVTWTGVISLYLGAMWYKRKSRELAKKHDQVHAEVEALRKLRQRNKKSGTYKGIFFSTLLKRGKN